MAGYGPYKPVPPPKPLPAGMQPPPYRDPPGNMPHLSSTHYSKFNSEPALPGTIITENGSLHTHSSKFPIEREVEVSGATAAPPTRIPTLSDLRKFSTPDQQQQQTRVKAWTDDKKAQKERDLHLRLRSLLGSGSCQELTDHRKVPVEDGEPLLNLQGRQASMANGIDNPAVDDAFALYHRGGTGNMMGRYGSADLYPSQSNPGAGIYRAHPVNSQANGMPAGVEATEWTSGIPATVSGEWNGVPAGIRDPHNRILTREGVNRGVYQMQQQPTFQQPYMALHQQQQQQQQKQSPQQSPQQQQQQQSYQQHQIAIQQSPQRPSQIPVRVPAGNSMVPPPPPPPPHQVSAPNTTTSTPPTSNSSEIAASRIPGDDKKSYASKKYSFLKGMISSKFGAKGNEKMEKGTSVEAGQTENQGGDANARLNSLNTSFRKAIQSSSQKSNLQQESLHQSQQNINQNGFNGQSYPPSSPSPSFSRGSEGRRSAGGTLMGTENCNGTATSVYGPNGTLYRDHTHRSLPMSRHYDGNPYGQPMVSIHEGYQQNGEVNGSVHTTEAYELKQLHTVYGQSDGQRHVQFRTPEQNEKTTNGSYGLEHGMNSHGVPPRSEPLRSAMSMGTRTNEGMSGVRHIKATGAEVMDSVDNELQEILNPAEVNGETNNSTLSETLSMTPPLPPLSPENSPHNSRPTSPQVKSNYKLAHGGSSLSKPDLLGDSVAGESKISPVATQESTQKRYSSNSHHHTKKYGHLKRDKLTGQIISEGIEIENGDITSTTTGLDMESLLDGTEMTSDDDASTTQVTLHKQLQGLETMYSQVLRLLGSKKGGLLDSKSSRRRMHGSLSSLPSSIASRPVNASSKRRYHDDKRKGKESKSVNKRFQRLESHVVTLARSVAHLSSEMRTQHLMFQELEQIREELSQLKFHQGLPPTIGGAPRPPSTGSNGPAHWEDLRFTLPALTNPNRVKKLTKFFGDEPPLLRLFLKKLGYEKYAGAFEREKIGMIELPYVTEERLQKLGVPLGPRLRILQESQACALKQETVPNGVSVYIV